MFSIMDRVTALLTTAGDWVPIDSSVGLLPGAVEWAQKNGYNHVGKNCIHFVNMVFMSPCQGVNLDAYFRRQVLIPRNDCTTGASHIGWGMEFPFRKIDKRPAEFEEPERVVRARVESGEVVLHWQPRSLMDRYRDGTYFAT